MSVPVSLLTFLICLSIGTVTPAICGKSGFWRVSMKTSPSTGYRILEAFWETDAVYEIPRTVDMSIKVRLVKDSELLLASSGLPDVVVALW